MSSRSARVTRVAVLPGHGADLTLYRRVAEDMRASLGLPVEVLEGPVAVDGGCAWWGEPDEGPSDATCAAVHERLSDGGPGVAVVGFSQGASMASVVGSHPAVAALVLIAGFLPHPSSDVRVEAMPVLCLVADDDDIVDPFHSSLLARSMVRRGGTVEEVERSGGHRWDDEVTSAVCEWLRSMSG